MATRGPRWGDRVSRRFDPVDPQEGPLELSALQRPESSDYFIQRIREIEAGVEDLVQRRMGDKYPGYDPFKMHLGYLAPEEQEEIRSEIMTLLGAEGLLNRGIGPTMIRDYVDEAGREVRSPAGRFLMSPQAIMEDPRAAYLSQATLRFFKGRGETPAGNYTLANTLPRIDSLLHNQDLLSNFIEGHGKTLVFDVESASLNPDEDIWQLSAQILHDDGTTEPVKSFYFDNAALRRGLVRDQESGQMMRLDKYLLRGREGDFEHNMRQFFDMTDEVTNVAGHNVMFDFNMLAHTVKKHKVYRTNEDFRNRADQFFAKFYNPETKEIGNVIDTGALSRMVLPHVGVASELKNSQNPYSHSLQNLLMQTNLSNFFSEAQMRRFIARGLHYADVDVPIETMLLQAMRTHLRGTLPIEIGPNFLQGELRKQVARSAPIGPNIEMANPELYHNAIFGGAGKLSPLEQMSILSRRMNLRSSVLPADSDLDLTSRASVEERTIGWMSKRPLLTRDMRYLDSDANIPDPSEWYEIQKELAAQGVPMPGLSLYERHISSILSTISGPGMEPQEAAMRELIGSNMLGLGRFVGAESIAVKGKNARLVTMPMKYLREWEEELRAGGHEALAPNFIEGGQMVGLSPFEWQMTPESAKIKEVSLNLKLSEEQYKSLWEYLARQQEFQGEAGQNLLNQIADAFGANSGKYGVQIGTLSGITGRQDEASSTLHDILKYYGSFADYSDQNPMFSTAFAGTGDQIGRGTENTIYTAGAFLRGDLLGEQERRSLVGEIANMITGYEQLTTARSPMGMHILRGVKSDPRSMEEAIKWANVQKRIFKSAPYAALGTVLAAGGYYTYKRHEENKKINATFAPMAPEPAGWSKQNYYQAVPYNPRRNPHRYLDTANVVDNLDNNKIGHTNMNQQTKYSYLFTGGGFNS